MNLQKWKRISTIERFTSKKEVANEVKCHYGKTWGSCPGKNLQDSHFNCTDCVNCTVTMKVITTKDGSLEVWTSDDNHYLASIARALMRKSGKLIKEIQGHHRKDALNYFLKGARPLGCIIRSKNIQPKPASTLVSN